MTETDRRGLPVATGSAEAAAHFREATSLFVRGQPGAGPAFDAACAADEQFCEAHAGRAFAALYDGDSALADVHLARARAGAGMAGERAGGLLAAVEALSHLNADAAVQVARTHLDRFPTDELAREAVGLVLFLLGRSDAIVDLYDWLAPRQGDDWSFNASWSFACHEVGRLAQAQALGTATLAAQPDHTFAVHSLAHVAYESGAHDEGAALVREFLAAHDAIAFQRRHLRWHLALNLLAGGHEGEVPALWEQIAPASVPTPLGAVEDGCGLLWRWHLYGLGEWELPWEELAEPARQVAAVPVVPLPAACAAVALAALGDAAGLTLLHDTADSMQRAGLPVPVAVLRAVADAATASFALDWAAVADALVPVRSQFSQLGGSRAQRELFDDALIVGLLRSGRSDQAAPLLEARLGRRPSTRDRAWFGAAP
jgi:hypothetical protein